MTRWEGHQLFEGSVYCYFPRKVIHENQATVVVGETGSGKTTQLTQNILQQWFQDTRSRFWDKKPRKRDSDDVGNSCGRLPYQRWNVCKYGTCVDAAISGIMSPPLIELQSSQRYYCAVTVGEDAMISASRWSRIGVLLESQNCHQFSFSGYGTADGRRYIASYIVGKLCDAAKAYSNNKTVRAYKRCYYMELKSGHQASSQRGCESLLLSSVYSTND